MDRQPDEDAPGTIGAAGARSVDATDRLEIERLRAEIERLRAGRSAEADEGHRRVLEGIPAPVFVTVADERIIEFVNRAGLDLLGVSAAEEVIGRSLLDFVHPEDRADAIERGQRILRGDSIAPVSQGRIIRADGSEVVVERSVTHDVYRGRPVLQSVFYDITARVRTEAALEMSEARFRDLAESSLLGLSVVTVDEPGRVLYANRAYKRLLGCPEHSDLRGLPFMENLVAPHERERLAGYRTARRAGRAAPSEYEYQALRVDGVPVTLRQQVTMLAQPWDGQRALMLGVVDVTAERRAEEALRESEARFKDFAEAASDWYWEMDAEQRVTYVSERFEQLTGARVEEVIGKTRDEALAGKLPPDERAQEQKWARLREAIAARQSYRDFVYRWIDRDGRTRTMSSSALPVFGVDGVFRGYRGIGRDITAEAQIRRALEDEREQLARAEATAALGNWEWRVDSGETVWSSGMYRIAGVEPGAFVVDSSTAITVFHQDDVQTVRDALRWCLKTAAPVACQARVVRPDGSVRRVAMTAECESDHHGRVELMFGVVQDVTDRDRAEALLRDAIESIPDGFAIYDTEDRLTLFNDAYREGAHGVQDLVRPGLAFEDLIRAYVERGAFSDESTAEPAWLERRLAWHRNPGPPFELEFSDGTAIRIIERRTREGGTVVLRMDITEARRAEALLRDAFESVPHAFLLWDADDRLVMANEAFYEEHGGDRRFVRPGARFEDVMTARVRRGLLNLPRGREEAHIRERIAQHRNGSGEPFELEFSDGRWFEIRESRTRVGGTLSFRTDVTERKRAERELARHRERLQELVGERTRELADAQTDLLRAERLAAIGQLTATVSHELRNPLGTLRTSVYVLEKHLGEPPLTVRRNLERIYRSVDRCVSIIEELLAYTRERPLALEFQRLGGWCEHVVERFDAPEGIAIAFDRGVNPELRFDDERLRQALDNVLHNAVQAIESASAGAPRGTVRVSLGERDGALEIRVEDDGPGIESGALEHVFEPLFSTRPFGVGLGLSVVRQALEQHGGGVDIEGVSHGGTRVVLWMPHRPVDRSAATVELALDGQYERKRG